MLTRVALRCVPLLFDDFEDILSRFVTGELSWRCTEFDLSQPFAVRRNVWGWADGEASVAKHSHLFGPEPANLFHDDLQMSLEALSILTKPLPFKSTAMSPQEMHRYSLANTVHRNLGGLDMADEASPIGSLTFSGGAFCRLFLERAICKHNGESPPCFGYPQHPAFDAC